MAYPRENSIIQSNYPAANAAAVVTFNNPGANFRWRIKMIVAGYSAAPTGGSIVITDTVHTLNVPVIAGGPTLLNPLDLQWSANETVTVTLAAAGASVTGGLFVVGVVE